MHDIVVNSAFQIKIKRDKEYLFLVDESIIWIY